MQRKLLHSVILWTITDYPTRRMKQRSAATYNWLVLASNTQNKTVIWPAWQWSWAQHRWINITSNIGLFWGKNNCYLDLVKTSANPCFLRHGEGCDYMMRRVVHFFLLKLEAWNLAGVCKIKIETFCSCEIFNFRPRNRHRPITGSPT